jgi:bloom syndrome protein
MSKKRKSKSVMPTVMDEDDEDDEDDADRDLHANGYERDNFVVSDEDAEEAAFGPRPPRRLPVPQQRQQTLDELGPPISRDPALDDAGLDDMHQDIVQAFVERAHVVEENLRNKHGLRRPIFTEHQYREMAIRWTTTVAQMYTIRGVDRSKVDLYGAKFASLALQFQEHYQEMMGQEAQSFSAADMAPRRKKKREVVDLISDDEDCGIHDPRPPHLRRDPRGFHDPVVQEGDEEDEGDFEDDEEENLESSRYFGGGGGGGSGSRAPAPDPSAAADVQQWHRRLEELKKAAPKPAYPSEDSNRSSGANWKGGGKKSFFGRNRGGRGGSSRSGGSGGSFSRASSTGGVSKRKGSVSRQFGGGSSSAAGSGRGRPAGGSRKSGGAGGGIPSMPY